MSGGRPRSATCPRGHEWTEANTLLQRDGSRRCRICRNAYARARQRVIYDRDYRALHVDRAALRDLLR